MAFKGVLPSDLWEKYDCEGGAYKMQLDMQVAMDINNKIADATQDSKTDGKSAVSRMKQKREQRKLLSNGGDLLQALRDSGVPIKGESGKND